MQRAEPSHAVCMRFSSASIQPARHLITLHVDHVKAMVPSHRTPHFLPPSAPAPTNWRFIIPDTETSCLHP